MRGGNRGQDRGRREPEPAARFNGEDLADRCPGRAPEVASAHQVRPGQVGGLLELGKQGVPAAHVLIKAPRAAGLQDRANSVSAAGASLTEHSSPQVTTASNFRPPREGPGSVAALPSQDSSNGDLGGCPMRGVSGPMLSLPMWEPMWEPNGKESREVLNGLCWHEPRSVDRQGSLQTSPLAD